MRLPLTTPGWPESRRILAFLFLVGFLPRLVLLWLIGTNGLETWEYEVLATNIAAGRGYVIPWIGTEILAFGDGNLYSFLAAGIYTLIGPRQVILALVQMTLASLTAPFVYILGKDVFGPRVGFIAAILAATYPGLLVYSTKLHALNIDILLLVLLVLHVHRLSRTYRSGLVSGVALGLCLMTRPTFFLAGLAALGVKYLAARRAFGPTVLAVAVAIVIAGPWVARNWVALGRPVFSTVGSEDIWKGNNPLATGTGYAPTGQPIVELTPPDMRTQLRNASELERDAMYMAAVLDFVREQPAEFVSLVARKFFYFWWFSPQAGLLYPPAWLGVYAAYYSVVLAFAILGSVLAITRGNRHARELVLLIGAVSLTVAFVHALAFVEGRHRWGITPLLLLLTARGLDPLLVSVARRARRSSVQRGLLRSPA